MLLDAARRQQRFVRVDEHRWVELSADAARARSRPSPSRPTPRRTTWSCRPARCPRSRALAERGRRRRAAPRAGELLGERLAASRPAAAEAAGGLAADAARLPARGLRVAGRGSPRGAPARASPTTWASARPCRRSRCSLDRARRGPALVLAPTSVAFNWDARARALRADAAAVLYARGGRSRGVLAEARPRDVLVASYGLLVRDAEALAAQHVRDRCVSTRRRPSRTRRHAARAGRARARRRVPGRALGDAVREPPRRAVEPVLDRVPGAARQLGPVPRSLRHPDRARQGSDGARGAVARAAAVPAPAHQGRGRARAAGAHRDPGARRAVDGGARALRGRAARGDRRARREGGKGCATSSAASRSSPR